MKVPLVISPSGASETCPACGTIYDRHWVDVSDYVPSVGDGCANCSPEEELDEFVARSDSNWDTSHGI